MKTMEQDWRTPVSVISAVKDQEGLRISLLLVFHNPLDLDRLCRQLEKDGDISAEISSDGETALHIMQYIRFHVIVMDYPSGHSDPLWFVKLMRTQSLCTPLVYCVRISDTPDEEEGRRYGPVFFIPHQTGWPLPDTDNLERVIRHAAAGPEEPVL